MQYDSATITKIITISQYVLADKMLSYVTSLANGLKTPNDKTGCGCLCGIKSLYQFIDQALYRQSEMTDNENYQTLIAQIFRCMSLQPDYYTFTGGVDVINAVITPVVTPPSWEEKTMWLTPPSGTTVIPFSDSDQALLKGATVLTILRNGTGMQDQDNTRGDYYSFNSTTGQIIISNAANGEEIFQVIYSVVANSGTGGGTTPSGGTSFPIYFTTTAGQTTYQSNDLIGATLLYLSIESNVLYKGAGSDEMTGLDPTTGTVTWNYAAGAGERAVLIYEK